MKKGVQAMSNQNLCFTTSAPLTGQLKRQNGGLRFAGRSSRPCTVLLPHRHSQPRMQQQPHSLGKISLYCGISVLAGVLANRLLLTPLDSLAMTQSRSDILGVISGAALVLYGVGKAEITDRKQKVVLDGIEVREGFGEDALSNEVAWAANALLTGIPNMRSFVLVVSGKGRFFAGLFREEEVQMHVLVGGVVDNAITSGRRAYMADMKVVPVQDVEFGFLPKKCQATLVLPLGTKGAIILGADKPRPLTGGDFGWIQAIGDRLEQSL